MTGHKEGLCAAEPLDVLCSGAFWDPDNSQDSFNLWTRLECVQDLLSTLAFCVSYVLTALSLLGPLQ